MTIEKLYILFLAQGQKITTDTRKIEKGQIFFALKGGNFDGNKFALDSISKGARYAVVDDTSLDGEKNIIVVDDVLQTLQSLALHHRRVLNIPIIAITGSNGKTTTKELVKEVLAQRFKVAYTKGNLNNHIGIPLTLLDIKAYEDISIVEMGANHQGEIASYCQYTEPNFGVITNIGKAHLEGFGGIDGVIKGKTELYRYLETTNGKVFINADDEVLMQQIGNLAKMDYGTSNSLSIYGKISDTVDEYLTAEIYEDDKIYIIRTNLTGDYNLYNVLLAYTIGRYFEIDPQKIIQAIEQYLPSNSRSQILKKGKQTIILDAYNANPSSMEVALQNLAKFEGEKTAILGAMKELGEYTEAEHQKIVDFALSLNLNKIVLIGSEFNSISTHPKLIYFDSTSDAKDWYKSQNFTAGTVLIKGSRSMALEKILANE